MNFLKPPITEYSDHYDITRFNLVWNLCLVLIVLLSLVSIVNIQNANYSSLTNIIEVGIGIVSLIILKKTKKFKLVCLFTTICTFVLITIAFFTITKAVHYTTPMWGTVNVLFAFFMLGRNWGLTILIGHFTVLVFYYVFRIESNIENLPPFDTQAIWNFIIETCIVGLAMGYLLLKFIRANTHAEEKVQNSNDELTKQNVIISTQNKEKEVMLKEIHHRVKNNLQVITSLLRLQSQEITDAVQAESFAEAINRVKSMALIHDQMYQSDMIANFDLKSYLESLTNELIETYAVEKPIELDVDSEISNIEAKSIVPISLLFNELISNSIKHGFADKTEGKITVRVTSCDSAQFLCLKYSDNGVWKAGNKKSFGLELISMMTEQLEGQYSIDKTPEGTNYSFTLKALEVEE